MNLKENRRIGYVLYGTEGETRRPENIAYYHRADRLRKEAEARRFESDAVYSRRSSSDTSAIRRMLKSGWLRQRYGDFRAVYGASAEATGLAAWALRKTKVPVVYDVHTPHVGEKWMQFRMKPSLRNFVVYVEASVSELTCVKKSDMLLWCSSIQRDFYARRGYPLERMREVRHGVDLERFDIGPPAASGPPLLCYAGTMVGYQGADGLVRAYERVGNAKLRMKMIGFTPSDAGLRRRADAVGIITASQTPHDKLIAELMDSDCTVIVAHPDAVKYKNGAAPTKWPESLALGRPILSGEAYDTAQLIRDLGVGWVVGNTVEGMVEGMNRLAETPRNELAEMGRRARSEAVRSYGWETIGAKFAQALEEATKK
ncbi:MAG: glycosyltransferase [Fimbriimonadales bacterium]